MWGLMAEDGSLLRKDGKSQWDILLSAKKRDGSRFTKKEAQQALPGLKVYRGQFVKVREHSYVEKEESTYRMERTVRLEQLVPYTLVEV